MRKSARLFCFWIFDAGVGTNTPARQLDVSPGITAHQTPFMPLLLGFFCCLDIENTAC